MSTPAPSSQSYGDSKAAVKKKKIESLDRQTNRQHRAYQPFTGNTVSHVREAYQQVRHRMKMQRHGINCPGQGREDVRTE